MSQAEKNSFVLYVDTAPQFEMLSDEQAGRVIKAVFAYAGSGEVKDLDGVEQFMFAGLKAQLDRDYKKWLKVCERNRENGAKGGRPPKPRETHENPLGYLGSHGNPLEPRETQPNPKNPDEPDSDSDSDSVSGSDPDTDTENDHDSAPEEYRNIEISENSNSPPLQGEPLTEGQKEPPKKSARQKAEERERQRLAEAYERRVAGDNVNL